MRLAAALLLMLFATALFAGQKAITDTGEEVILNDDHTWHYVDAPRNTISTISTNPKTYSKPKSAGFQLKSTKNNAVFWIDADKWRFQKAKTNKEAEYEFQLKDGDLYGMAIDEAITIPMDTLADIALSNARNVAPDMRVVKKEYRHVNNTKAIYMEMQGTMRGIPISYFGYYYSDKSGSTQFLAYTGTGLVPKYRKQIAAFLSGFDAR